MNKKLPESPSLNPELLLDYSSDGILVLDDEGNILNLNHAATLLHRKKHHELLGQNLWDVYPDLLNTQVRSKFEFCLSSGRTMNFEQNFPSLYSWHTVLAVPSDGKLVLFCRDISDRIRMLETDAIQAGLRDILGDVPIAISITRGPKHRIEFQNRFAKEILNVQNVEGNLVVSAIPEAELQGFVKIFDEVFLSGKRFDKKQMLFTYPNKDGKLRNRFFDVTVQPLTEIDGQVYGLLHIGVDVTKRINEKSQIERLAAERNAVLEQLVEGIILTDANGKITFINESAYDMHGINELDVDVSQYALTYGLLTLEGEVYPAEQLPLARAVLNNETVKNAKWIIRRPDGSHLLVEGDAQPITDSENRKISCCLVMRKVLS